MSTRGELLRIATRIATQEPLIVLGMAPNWQIRWINTARFLPGLAIRATLAEHNRGDRTAFAQIEFQVMERHGEARLSLPVSDVDTDSDSDAFEDRFSQYILEAFRQYENRPNADGPAGISEYPEVCMVVAPDQELSPALYEGI